MSNGRFCILLTQCVGKKKEKTLLKKVTSKVDVLPGTLLFIVDVIKNSTTSQSNFLLETLDPDNIEITTDSSSFKEVSEDRYNLLITIPTCGERLTVFQNKDWLQEGLELEVNDYVEVYVKDLAKDVLGIIRYKGSVSGLYGIHFGIELVDHPGKGVSDGIFRKKRYFSCNEDSAVFVGLHRIRKCKRPSLGHRKHQAEGVARNYQKEISCMANGLSCGSRVVWMADHGPESGVVRWIGVLPDCPSSDDLTVGVEFDNPVGTGTGKYKDRRLFLAKQNHASLVPILGLMKEEEFYNVKPREGVNEDTYLSDELCFTAEALAAGKSQEEVIEEQHRMLEIAKQRASRPPVESTNQNPTTKLSGNRSPIASGDITVQKRVANLSDYGFAEKDLANKQGFTVIETKADVYIPLSDLNGEGNNAINPLYEYSRSADDYLKEGLGAEALVSHGSHSNPSKRQNIPEPDPDLEVGSLVEVMSTQPLYGYIKWIGHLPDQKEPRKLIAGLEMEEEISAGTDGTFGQLRFFHCPPRKGLFVPLYRCRKDKRFQDERNRRSISSDTNFGSTETPDLPGTVSPPDSLQDIRLICGKSRGIQGHHNSCYMDATLLAMFYFTTVFDSILHREKNVQDIPEYTEVQQVLKEGIVNPLRRHHYVRADKVMKLRKLLDKVGKIPGMMSEEKDPEEFLNLLLNEITRAEPFLHISSADNQDTQHTYFYQLIMEKDEQLVLPTTQQLFELSFLQMGIKLKEIPSCLIIQMPRFGKDYKMYRRILPSLELDITDVLENAPRECIICGDLAAFECQECYQVHGAGLYTIAFCEGCKITSHQHKQRVNHRPKPISVPQGFKLDHARRKASGKTVTIPREKMELFAVVCIQTSHYVSFVKCGRGRAAKWIFFDSMADRMGEQSGYNIPEIKDCSQIPTWLSEEYYNDIMKYPEDKTLPEHMRRLICDAYICMYQSPDVMMFK